MTQQLPVATVGKSPLGRLEPVNLRDVWQVEALDFTPWLAQEKNIALLGGAIGLELEVDSTEQGVGPYLADILCKDTINGHLVQGENQLERTDHTRREQLLTSAAGLEAATVVWVASQFTDEHRAALDWLNQITSSGFNFFGLEIQLWRIGGSPSLPSSTSSPCPTTGVRRSVRALPLPPPAPLLPLASFTWISGPSSANSWRPARAQFGWASLRPIPGSPSPLDDQTSFCLR